MFPVWSRPECAFEDMHRENKDNWILRFGCCLGTNSVDAEHVSLFVFARLGRLESYLPC